MRIHLIEHETEICPRTNIFFWAAKNGHQVEQTFIFRGQKPPSLDAFDWLMIMGGSQHVYEMDKNPWLVPEKQLLKDTLSAGKMVLGICLGAQLLADALGGRVFPNRHREIGWHEVTLTSLGRESYLFQNVPDQFVTFHWHSDHFSLPQECSRLGCSRISSNQAFSCDGMPAVGLQFHPEYTVDMIRNSSRTTDKWTPGPFVAGKKAILSQMEKMPDTYCLMENLLDNMLREFRTKKS